MTRRPLIALIDFRRDGHHLTNLRFFHKVLRATGYRVVAFCPAREELEPFLSPEEKEGSMFVKFPQEVGTHRWIRKTSGSENLHRFRRCARLLRRFEAEHAIKIDLVFFAALYFGSASAPRQFDKVFPYRWVAVLLDSRCIRQNWFSRARRLRTWDSLGAFRARNCAGLAILDQGIVRRISRRLGHQKPVFWLPEPSTLFPPNPHLDVADRIVARANGRPVIGCYGQFGLRKGSLEFIRVARLCHDEPWLFAWIGELDLRNCGAHQRRLISDFAADPPQNCFVELPGRLESDRDFDRLIEISTVLFACYHDHIGSSGAVTKAGFFEKPVVIHDRGCMAEEVRRYGLGLCVREGSRPEKYREAIQRALAQHGFEPRYRDFQADHSHERQVTALRKLVANALAVPD